MSRSIENELSLGCMIFSFRRENRCCSSIILPKSTKGSFSPNLAGARVRLTRLDGPIRVNRARRWAMGAGAVGVLSDRGSGWLSGDRWVAAEVAVRAVAAVGPGTVLSLRLRGAGPCPPSRGHTTGAGRRVRGAGADADAAGPGPRRSIPSPAAF